MGEEDKINSIPKIRDETDLEIWLDQKPQIFSIVLASRIALRVASFISSEISKEHEENRTSVYLTVFRALQICKAKAIGAEAIEAKRASRSAGLASRPISLSSSSADTAVFFALHTVSLSHQASKSATHSAAYFASQSVQGIQNFWRCISYDVFELASGRLPEDLIISPLWPYKRPQTAVNSWQEFRSEILELEAEDWGVWVDWYEAQLAGEAIPNLALEEAILLIPDEIWEAGPKVANAEIRRLMQVHAPKPTLPALVEAVSPQPSIESHLLGVQANRVYDAPEASDELASLPQRQRSLIRTMRVALKGNGNIPEFVSFALEEYSEELLVRGTRPFLGILNDQHQVVRDEYTYLDKNGFIEKDGVGRLFRQFSANHRQIRTNFPLDAKREAMYVQCLVDWAKVDVGTVRTLAMEFGTQAETLGQSGLATGDFVKVSLSIATDLRAALDNMPTSPNAVTDGALRWQDRAVIRAMCFPDAVRQKVRESRTMEATMASQDGISFVLVSERIAKELAAVVF